MAAYIVMEPQGSDGIDATDRAVLVRDGFHFVGFIVPPLWLVWQKLWIEAALALAAGIALGVLGEIAGFGVVGSCLSLLVGLYVGLEGANLKLAALRRRGWREWGVVEADNAAEAEIRYLSEVGHAGEAARPQAVIEPARPSPRPLASSGPALGLFHYPGKP